MANRNSQGFGFIPAGRLGGGPSIQGQGKNTKSMLATAQLFTMVMC